MKEFLETAGDMTGNAVLPATAALSVQLHTQFNIQAPATVGEEKDWLVEQIELADSRTPAGAAAVASAGKVRVGHSRGSDGDGRYTADSDKKRAPVAFVGGAFDIPTDGSGWKSTAAIALAILSLVSADPGGRGNRGPAPKAIAAPIAAAMNGRISTGAVVDELTDVVRSKGLDAVDALQRSTAWNYLETVVTDHQTCMDLAEAGAIIYPYSGSTHTMKAITNVMDAMRLYASLRRIASASIGEVECITWMKMAHAVATLVRWLSYTDYDEPAYAEFASEYWFCVDQFMKSLSRLPRPKRIALVRCAAKPFRYEYRFEEESSTDPEENGLSADTAIMPFFGAILIMSPSGAFRHGVTSLTTYPSHLIEALFPGSNRESELVHGDFSKENWDYARSHLFMVLQGASTHYQRKLPSSVTSPYRP